MDMIMPEMEGLETIKQIRQHFPAIKIIAISGGGSLKPRDYLDVARKLGADLTLMKPCDREELLDAARQLLARQP
jgi:CheY-like chemotaxis protein